VQQIEISKDNLIIETVLIPQKTTDTICISTQVGCPVGCKFCKSGTFFERNLTTEEILEQIEETKKNITKSNKKLSIVFMGIGEPLLNIKNVFESIKKLCVDNKDRLSKRRITISTVGIPEKIIELANLTKTILDKDNSTVNLAISLHFPDDKKRKELIPFANKYSIDEIMKSCEIYQSLGNKKQRIMFEYIMLEGINDSEKDIDNLVKVIKKYDIRSIINLIPYNGTEYNTTHHLKIKEYKQRIIKEGIKCFIRLSRGTNINAACGMLASKTIKK